ACPLGPDWPFGGVATQRITLDADHLRAELAVTAGNIAMPAQVGWHPWFWKPGSADLRFDAMYQRDSDGIPTGELVAPPAGPADDCFVRPLGPLQLHHDEVTITIDSDCDHWVVYSQQRRELCVEPQSGPPDGFTLAPFVLQPGETLRRWMTIGWSAVAGLR
ncbi:MAG TPA: hypothetical protein PLV68_20810, partial [Ilumatobacteraceae bacterium]|nr:hypothetical protein [Ilumatobacteraceae bacterium]